jgi:serine protease Do
MWDNKLFSLDLSGLSALLLIGILIQGGLKPNFAAAESQDNGQRPFTFAGLVKKERPAVVNISTTSAVQREGSLLGQGHPFREFFGDVLPHEFRGTSLGSGFIIKPDGLILTNQHVVEKAEKILVRLSDQEQFEAKLKGSDPKTDIALIQINSPKPLPFVKLGDSDQAEVGEWVIAIGNPFGLEQTVTVGIVSAKGRVIGAGPYDDYIQTDASINPGNSGGPLFNIQGEVIGINTAINPSGQGIGFAIPINLVKKVINQLEKEGKVTRGWLGVMIQEFTRDLAKSFGLRGGEGALVSDVFEKSPAALAGIKKGDVIVEFDGKKIGHMRELPVRVAETPVGKQVALKILRDGREQKVMVRIGKMEENPNR